MNKLFIPTILGTARQGRQSESVANFILSYISEHCADIETQLVDVRDYHIEVTDKTGDSTEPWGDIADRAHGFIIISPEYNHSFPGDLKLLLDSAFKQYEKKPVGLVGVSAGNLGDARVVQALQTATLGMQMVPIYGSMYFSGVQDIFEDGTIKDPETYNRRCEKFMNELVWFAQTLQAGRE